MKIEINKKMLYSINSSRVIIGEVTKHDYNNEIIFKPKYETIKARLTDDVYISDIRCLIEELEQLKSFMEGLDVAEKLSPGEDGDVIIET